MKFSSICAVLFFALAGDLAGQGTYSYQPTLEGRSVSLLYEDGLMFKDLNKNGILDQYEDWRKEVHVRIDDLLAQMTLEERVGMLLINTLNADIEGRLSERAVRMIEDEKMTRFIFRNTITRNPQNDGIGHPFRGVQVTVYEAAQFLNAAQELAESTRLGIPAVFKSNARNHMDYDARAGINVEAGAFSAWPKEGGLAATQDLDLIADFGRIMAKEWTAIGLRGMYGYMGDLATEPRWYRIHETFTEHSEWASDIMFTLVSSIQGKELGPNSVALTIKHFPGGGPQEGGGDPHYDYGKNQIYPADKFDYHLAPFEAAVNAGASSIMAYYGIPVNQPYLPNHVGMAFSKGIITDLLRKKLGFPGYVNSDTGIIGDRAWGLEDKSTAEQILMALDAGTDVLSGFDDNAQLLELVSSGKLSEERVDLSVRRLLKEQFELGLFENPYVDPNRAEYVVGNPSFQRKADMAQRKSIVLLQNELLPLAPGTAGADLKLFTLGVDADIIQSSRIDGIEQIAGEYVDSIPLDIPAVDAALIRVHVTTTRPRARMFGGAAQEDLDLISFTAMAKENSWVVTPSLSHIQQVMESVGAENTVLSIDFRQPYVLDEPSGILKAGALLATFGVSDEALIDVVLGKFNPGGKLPFALAKDLEAIRAQNPDAPGYPAEDTLFPFGHGLSYEE